MKYHKIKNINLQECTCEQKIAYNLAFSNAHLFKKAYENTPAQFNKSSVIYDAVKFCIKQWRNSYSYTQKYDIDAIFCALNSGLENYIKAGCPVLASYEAIGEMFPANYL